MFMSVKMSKNSYFSKKTCFLHPNLKKDSKYSHDPNEFAKKGFCVIDKYFYNRIE